MATLPADSASRALQTHKYQPSLFVSFLRMNTWQFLRNMAAGTATLSLLGAIAVQVQAQNVAFDGAQTTVGTGLNNPQGVTLDGHGNIFIADTANNRVVEVPLGGGPEITIGSGLNGPISVAVDAAGNVFIADLGTNTVVEVPANGGAQTTVGSGLSSPRGVAVDGSGNVFIGDSGNNRVLEVPADGSAQFTVGSGFNFPGGLLLDAAGDLFVADIANDRVVEVPADGSAEFTVGSGFSLPAALAFDTAGNLYVADYAHGRIVEVPADGSAEFTVPAIGLTFPQGVAVDGAGDVFIGDSDNNRIVELQRVVVNFGSVTVCSGHHPSASCNATLTLYYTATAGQTFGPTRVLTENKTGLDYSLASGSTCTGWIRPGTTCTVNVTFTPLALGLRSGTVKVVDSSNNVLVTTHLRGLGVRE